MALMIQLSGVSKSFAGTNAVDQVDLRAAPGDTTVLIGPSGCGKSTLIRMMIGLVVPDAGTVTVGETALTSGTAEAVRRRTGYVIQDGGLFPHMTARENATVMARYLGRPDAETASRLNGLAALTHFPGDALDRYPAELSGGQRQRVSLMRALMLDPDILLLDEPLGALDPMIRYGLQTDLRGIFRTLGKTVVIVTHDLAEAAYFADTIVLMNEGRIVQAGSMADLTDRPADGFVTRFIAAQRGPAEADA